MHSLPAAPSQPSIVARDIAWASVGLTTAVAQRTLAAKGVSILLYHLLDTGYTPAQLLALTAFQSNLGKTLGVSLPLTFGAGTTAGTVCAFEYCRTFHFGRAQVKKMTTGLLGRFLIQNRKSVCNFEIISRQLPLQCCQAKTSC